VTWFKQLSWKKRLGVLFGTGFALFVAFVGIGYAVTSVPDPNKVAIEQATVVKYADGSVMGKLGTNRQIVPLSKISKAAQHAVLAAEDRNFYHEAGISPKGILRAMFSNVKAGGTTQGGSTITQQYAKNAFLTQKRTYTRKVKEVFIALKMSETVSKDKILENYLNTIYFGRGAYGIQSAAQTFFRVDAAKLTPAQAAVLASGIKSPSGLDPVKHPERAKERWTYVLKGMAQEGWLSEADRDAAVYPRIFPLPESFQGPLALVRDQIIENLGREGFPEDRITSGGLVVTTTVTRKAEEAAVAAMQDALKGVPATGNHAVGALASVEPGTGKVVAYVGALKAGDFDYAGGGKGNEPGSGMKPYVLAAALEDGKSLDTRYDGSSPQDICGDTIHNDAGDPPFGRIDLATALAHSVNTVYYRLGCDVGAQRVADTAHAAGIPDSQPLADPTSKKPTTQIVLGADGYQLHPLDQAIGYASFAAKGTRARAYFVQRVTDTSGNELYKAKPDTGRAFSEGVAADVTYAMQQVVQNGTGTQAQLDGGRPTAGKTGTTDSGKNAWFTGFTPQLSTSVLITMSKGGPIQLNGSTNGIYGGSVPAATFKSYMDKALAGAAIVNFPPRANVGNASTPSTSTPTAAGTPSATPSATPSVIPTVSLPPVLPTSSPTSSPSPSAAPPTQSPPPSEPPSPQASAVASPAASP
jgi:membrane peptidoglycan carboxypeptidase